MSLEPGKRLGPYEIVSRIGVGGMGEVWQATDTRLERQVAIKILPSGFAASDTSRARFEREAKMISSLSHPNICTLFDVGQEDGADFLVMELLEGESLADRLDRGALPFPEVLRYGAQIAEALDTAHKQSIVHRDLKPANVMLTKGGAKLLDFGLARVATEDAPVTELTQTMGQARPLTEEGTILGTFQYMSPEQLEGQEAGARTDIFALGALLYEMATGGRAFEGGNRTSLIAAIVSSTPPPVSSLAKITPPAFDHVVHTCLQKDPDDRWQSARDVANQLRWIGTAGSEAGIARSVASARRVRRKTLVAIAIAGWLIAIAAGLWMTMNRSTEVLPMVRKYSWPVEKLDEAAPSPDGSRLAYIADEYLHVRRIDDAKVRRIDDSRGAYELAWSPDGTVLAYNSRRSATGNLLAVPEVRRVPADGVTSTTIARVDGLQTLSFGDAETLYVASAERGGSRILTVPLGGGEPRPWLEPRLDEPQLIGFSEFALLPDGESLLCVIDEDGVRSVAVRSGDRFERVVTAPEGGRIGYPVYSASGHVLYVQNDSPSAPSQIWAVPFDASMRSVTGSPVLVVPFAFKPQPTTDGSLWFVRVREDRGPHQLVTVDRTGRILDRIGQPQTTLFSPELSPDGTLVAVGAAEDDDTQDIWIHDVERSIKTRLSWDVVRTWRPTWSPDGGRVAFQSRDRRNLGRSDIYVQDTDGRSPPQQLVATELDEYGPYWSSDGRFILYTVTKEDTDRDLWFVEVDSGREPQPFLASRFKERLPYSSPDGRFVAYVSDRTGRPEVFVTTFPEPGREIQISSNGGFWPQWNNDEIVYIEPDTEILMAVPATTSPQLKLGDAVALFAESDSNVILARGFDSFYFAIMPDKERFIAVQDLSPKRDQEIAVIENWVEILE